MSIERETKWPVFFCYLFWHLTDNYVLVYTYKTY